MIIASFRIPLMKYILEFPAGLMDDANLHENAARELREETGTDPLYRRLFTGKDHLVSSCTPSVPP
jgi:8-oxo-dGTP pyrophosphatase MutT (NUDIX family)